MANAVQADILDLRHFSAGALRPLLDEEASLWGERLRWDYRSSAKLLLDYLNGRILPGFVAVEGQRVVGYVFCVYEGDKAVIGDVFASGSAGEPAKQIELRLLDHLIELLQHSPGVDRIETQLLLHAHGRFESTFSSTGFEAYQRLFMERSLFSQAENAQDAHPENIPLPRDLELRSWRESDFPAAGRLIAHSYKDHLDSAINDQYRTVSGSLRFLHNIVRFPGCGIFDPSTSLVLACRGRDELAGLLLCSRVSEGVGHITQICVAPSHRHMGLGRLLLAHCFSELASRDFSLVTLTVTDDNSGAVSLYRDCGFTVRHAFDAMVWDQRTPRP